MSLDHEAKMRGVISSADLRLPQMQPDDVVGAGRSETMGNDQQALELDNIAAHDPLLGPPEAVSRSRIIRKPLPSSQFALTVKETRSKDTQMHTKSEGPISSQMLLVDSDENGGSPKGTSTPCRSGQERATSSHTRHHVRRNMWEMVFHIIMGLAAGAFIGTLIETALFLLVSRY